MDFKRLGYFVQVAELGSLSKTSERLRIAQPSLSRQMRLLEEELGVTLFIRGPRGTHLTDAGQVLFNRTAGPMREIGRAIYEVRSLPNEAGGSVVLGLPPTLVQLLAGPLARRVAAYAPNISLRIVDSYTGHLLKWMRDGELDVAILYGPTPAGVNAAKLLEDEVMLVGPANAKIGAEGAVDLRKLEGLPMILPSSAHGLRILIETAAEKAGVRLDVHTQADSFHVMKELVESGLGYTVLPMSGFAREAAAGRLTFARFRKPQITRQLFLALKPAAEYPRATLQIERMIRQEVADLVQDGRRPSATVLGIGDA